MVDHRMTNIAALSKLGVYLQDLDQADIQTTIDKAYVHNPWFTPDNITHCLKSISEQIESQDRLHNWMSQYSVPTTKKNVGLILAGNIPAVGWNDILCTILIGHNLKIKYSEKDNIIIPFLIDKLISFEPQLAERFHTVERLSDFDAVIATGSNNTAKYFEQYFGHKPHIIRKNRNGVAILDGTETKEDIINLGNDIFTYFGLGCRNVSKIYIPKDYDFNFFLETIHDQFKELAHHNKYKNNIDYNIALYLLNKVKYQNNGCLIILEDPRFISRIASLHYEYYEEKGNLVSHLNENLDNIQCIVSKGQPQGLTTFPLGQAQHPAINDYADGVDTMDFLVNI